MSVLVSESMITHNLIARIGLEKTLETHPNQDSNLQQAYLLICD